MGSKRKRGHRRHSNHVQTSPPNDSKRRRLSQESEKSPDETARVENGRDHDQGREDDNDGGWTKVVSKSSRAANKGQNGDGHDRPDYPRLRYHKNYQGIVRISDLRDLSLYLLADEVAPKWIAIANSKYVRKVVTILVPGLDEKLLRRAESQYKERGRFSVIARTDSGQNSDHTRPDQEVAKSGESKPRTDTVEDQTAGSTPTHSMKSRSWMFEDVLQVKAPGDVKAKRVHSPLQAILLAPDQESKKNNPRFDQARSYQADPTPITEFVHDADELRDAEFPIHPASFTNNTDAELESARREKTGQSTNLGWVDTRVSESQVKVDGASRDPISRGTSIYSIDCEMVQTSDGANSLARVSVIMYPDGKIIIDKYVKPKLPITNYFTQFSGITPEILENVTTTLEDIQTELLQLLTPSCILLGHSLDSDLNALKLTHPFLVDTSLIYPHPRGLPLRSSLKYLANKYLKREIQKVGANGHNSVEDAQAVLDLVKLKCERGPKWGTMEANGEPVFRRLKRSGRTSAMVEYGTPERGYGKDATHTIGCQDDDEIVAGVIRAVKGDDFFDFEIPAGGVDFVWGRLRALEYARGWASGASSTFRQAQVQTQTQSASNEDETKDDGGGGRDASSDSNGAVAQGNGVSGGDDDDDQNNLDDLVHKTLDRIQRIHEALPEKTLLMVLNGTSDVRPVMRLQAQQQQYRKEFKVKKWDDLTVKWTDTEEQALGRACEDARAGWAVCTIK